MKIFLRLDARLHRDIFDHLLPSNAINEEAAFLFAHEQVEEESRTFNVIEALKLNKENFSIQNSDHLELTDQTRANIIKRAHNLNASLVELHSHVGNWPAVFSWSDRLGLKETVPHMWWRLKGRPYIAIVVAKSGYDALVWLNDPEMPGTLDGILNGHQIIQPTNLSIRDWR